MSSTKALLVLVLILTCILLPATLCKPTSPVATMKHRVQRRYDYIYECAECDEDKEVDLNATEYAYTDR